MYQKGYSSIFFPSLLLLTPCHSSSRTETGNLRGTRGGVGRGIWRWLHVKSCKLEIQKGSLSAGMRLNMADLGEVKAGMQIHPPYAITGWFVTDGTFLYASAPTRRWERLYCLQADQSVKEAVNRKVGLLSRETRGHLWLGCNLSRDQCPSTIAHTLVQCCGRRKLNVLAARSEGHSLLTLLVKDGVICSAQGDE